VFTLIRYCRYEVQRISGSRLFLIYISVFIFNFLKWYPSGCSFAMNFFQEKDFPQSNVLLCGAKTLEELLLRAPFPRDVRLRRPRGCTIIWCSFPPEHFEIPGEAFHYSEKWPTDWISFPENAFGKTCSAEKPSSRRNIQG
jgi:hypothetical protein